MKAVVNYFRDVRQELSKVTWPKKEEVIRLTFLVFICSAIVAVYLGALDYIFTKLLEWTVTR